MPTDKKKQVESALRKAESNFNTKERQKEEGESLQYSDSHQESFSYFGEGEDDFIRTDSSLSDSCSRSED
jgi:hypothetical protein